MNWYLLLMIVGAALTTYFTYDEYKKGKVTKKHLTKIALLSLAVVIIGLIQFFISYE